MEFFTRAILARASTEMNWARQKMARRDKGDGRERCQARYPGKHTKSQIHYTKWLTPTHPPALLLYVVAPPGFQRWTRPQYQLTFPPWPLPETAASQAPTHINTCIAAMHHINTCSCSTHTG